MHAQPRHTCCVCVPHSLPAVPAHPTSPHLMQAEKCHLLHVHTHITPASSLCLTLCALSLHCPPICQLANSAGWEVSSAARAARDKKPPVTLGSRTPEDNGFDRQEAIPIHSQTESKANRRLHRHFMLLRGNPHMQLL